MRGTESARLLRKNGIRSRHLTAVELEHQPLAAVSPHRFDRVDERVENASESLVRPTSLDERPDRHGHPLLCRFHLDRDLVVSTRLEHAEHRELKVVHPLVGEVEAAADSAEDQRGHPRVGRAGRDRERDLIAHVSLRVAPSPTLASVARPGDVEVHVETPPEGSATIVRVEGDLDMATSSELEQAFEGAIQPAAP